MKGDSQHTFTRQWLRLNHTVLFNGNRQILYYFNKPSMPSIPTPTIMYDKLEFDDTARKFITNYEDLIRNDLIIVATKPRKKFYRHQRTFYQLRKRHGASSEFDFGKIPSEHIVEWNKKYNAYRIKGKNAGPMGVGKWHHTSPRMIERDSPNILTQASKVIDSWYPFEVEREVEPTPIRELPIIRSDEENKIICFPLSQDEPSIAITGQKGGGKTFLMNSIMGRAFWYWNKKVIVLNDSLRQSDVLCQRWYSGSPFNKQLAMLGEQSIPLPAVYLTPEDFQSEKAYMEEMELGFKISLPFKELISNYSLFFKDSCWDLGNTTKYLKKYGNEFSKCKAINEIDDLIEELTEKKLIPDTSGPKMLAIFNEIFEKNILDISNRIPTQWRVVRKDEEGEIIAIVDYPPIIACIFANLVPVLITSSLVNKEYFPQYYKYIGKQIFKVHSEDKYFKDNEISTWIFIDELTTVASRTNRALPSEVLKHFVEQGRPIRIGTVYATQSYSELLHGVRQNTNYLFSLREMDRESKEIARDFNMTKMQQKELLSLKPREVMALTKLKFVTYDAEGNRREEEGPFRGYALPPLNASSVPKKVEV